MEFSRREYWSRLPCPLAGDLPNPGNEPASSGPPALAGRFFTTEPPGKRLTTGPDQVRHFPFLPSGDASEAVQRGASEKARGVTEKRGALASKWGDEGAGNRVRQLAAERQLPRSLMHCHPSSSTLSASQFSSVQSLSRVSLFATTWTTARQASLSIINSQSLLKLMSIELVMPSNHLILCCPLLLLPPNPPSIRVFSKESALCIRWPKYWSFSFSISPSNEHPGLSSFGMDWLGLLAVQGDSQESSPTPQFKNINSSMLSFLHSPTLTSIHDHWKIHSLD